MQLPEPVIGFIFPAQRYLRRRSYPWRHQLRQRHGLAEPQRITAAAASAQPDASDRASEILNRRLAARDRVLREQDDLIRAASAELDRNRAAEIRTPVGEVSARIVRFRWGDDVLTIDRSQAGGRTGGGGCKLPRRPGPARSAELRRQLAYHLAVLGTDELPPAR